VACHQGCARTRRRRSASLRDRHGVGLLHDSGRFGYVLSIQVLREKEDDQGGKQAAEETAERVDLRGFHG
jgi:hypothetical protein